MVSEPSFPWRRSRVIGLESQILCKIPNPLPASAADRPYSSSASARRPWPSRSIASSSGSGANREARPVQPSSLSGYGGGPNRCLAKVPDIVPGKIPKPASISGKITKSMVRYEEVASDPTAIWRIATVANHKTDKVQHQRGDFQKVMAGIRESLNRIEVLVQRVVSSQTRDLPDLVPPAEWENEKTRRSEDLRQIRLNSTQEIQPRGAPEGNLNSPLTGLSEVVATGWEHDQLPKVSVRRIEWENPKDTDEGDFGIPSWLIEDTDEGDFGIPSWLLGLSLPTPDPIQEPALVKQWPQNPKEYLSQPHSQYQPRQWNQQSETNLAVVNNPDEAKFDLAQLYEGERADKRLRCIGLFWKLPPWPDFCTMNCDSFVQHCEYEVIGKSYSVKQYSYNVLDCTDKIEELIKLWPSVNEDYYVCVESWDIISNPSKAAGLATMIDAKRPDFDNFDECVGNTTVRAFSVMASASGISALLPFLKAVRQSKNSWQTRYIGIKIVQQIAILRGCTKMLHLKSLVETIGHGLSDENQKMRINTTPSLAAFSETIAPYGIESSDMVLKPLCKSVRSHLGKVLVGYLRNEKLSIDEIKLTPLKLFELIASIKNGTIKGKIGKEILDELIAKGGIVKSTQRRQGLVQIADPAAIEAMDKKNNICNIFVIAHVDHGKSTLTDSLMAAGHTDLNGNASKDAMVLQKLGETIYPMKEDFIIIHLQYSCSHCCVLVVSGKRGVSYQCRTFYMCDKCYDAAMYLILAAVEVRAIECPRRLFRRSGEALFLLLLICWHNVARLVQFLPLIQLFEATEISVYEYFVKSRGMELRYSGDFPCISVGKLKRLTYFPIELCSLVHLQRYTKALSTLQRSLLVEKSRRKLQERMSVLYDVLISSNDDAGLMLKAELMLKVCGTSIAQSFTQVGGRVLNAPKLKAGDGEDIFTRNGRWNFNNKRLIKAGSIEKWAVINFSARCNVRDLVRVLIKCGSLKGIKVDQPFDVFEENPSMRWAPAVKRVDYWQQDKWNGCFPVKWHIVKDVPNNILKYIMLDNNGNKPVTNSRGTQGVKLEQGLVMLKIFKNHVSKTSIMDGLFKSGRTAAAKKLFKSLKELYKLQLPEGVGIHPVFPDSQLKMHCGPKAISSSDFSLVSKDSKLQAEPILVLENSVIIQWLIPWKNLLSDDASCNDANFIKGTLPEFYAQTIRFWFPKEHT